MTPRPLSDLERRILGLWSFPSPQDRRMPLPLIVARLSTILLREGTTIDVNSVAEIHAFANTVRGALTTLVYRRLVLRVGRAQLAHGSIEPLFMSAAMLAHADAPTAELDD